ncbi:hypothetical protein B0T17DRAFT_599823 [Bombardia bombarda]|uniref:Uncharacterized protein n=1 Tax=Bombardia bombarda TaxID=252184 RepID=A0AA39X1V6_9PEZI|nr:hypothetical protein B0T17DRAFT_599823 [Bombardia bombarda]
MRYPQVMVRRETSPLLYLLQGSIRLGPELGPAGVDAGLGGALQLVDVRGDAAGVGHELGGGEDDEGGELAADDEDDEEEGEAADVVGPAAAEEEVGAGVWVDFCWGGGGGGGRGVEQARVGVDLLEAGFVESQVGFAGVEEAREGGAVGGCSGRLSGGGRVEAGGLAAEGPWWGLLLLLCCGGGGGGVVVRLGLRSGVGFGRGAGLEE